MAYGLKYNLPLLSRGGTLYTLELSFDGYAGAVIARSLAGPQAIILRKDSSAYISGTSLEFGIREEVDFEFDEFYTNNPRKIKAVLKQNGTAIWTGFNIPQQYQAPYVPAPGTLRLTASDQLGLLKNESFSLIGLKSELEIIIYCLSFTGISLGFSIAINTFAPLHAENRATIAQTYSEALIYNDYNCYEVIEKILNKYDATITQAENRWYITCSADKESTRMLYSSAGVYESTEAAPSVLELGEYGKPGTEAWVSGSLTRAFTAGAKKGKADHDFGRKPSLLDNYDFSVFSSGEFYQWTQNGTFTLQQRKKDGKNYAFLQGYSSVTAHSIEQAIPIEKVDDQDFIFEIDYSPLGRSASSNGSIGAIYMDVRFIIALGDGVDTYYLKQTDFDYENASLIWGWVKNEENTIIQRAKAGITTPVWNRLRIVTQSIPISGTLLVWLGRYYFATTPRPQDYFLGIAYSDAMAYYVADGELYPSGLITDASFDDSSEPGDLGTIDIQAADAPDVPNKSQLYNNILRYSDGTAIE